MEAVVILVGAPGCGKSSVAGHLYGKDAVLCLDDYRRTMTGSADDQSADPAAVAVRELFLQERLAHRLPTVIDATNALAEYRHKIIGRARLHQAPVIALWWRVGVDECMRRMASRPRQVPREAVERIHAQIEREADDLRATAHLRIEIDADSRAVVCLGPAGAALPHAQALLEHARDLAERVSGMFSPSVGAAYVRAVRQDGRTGS